MEISFFALNTHKNALLVKGHLLLVLWILTGICIKLEQKLCNVTDAKWIPSYSNYFVMLILIRGESSSGQKAMEKMFNSTSYSELYLELNTVL